MVKCVSYLKPTAGFNPRLCEYHIAKMLKRTRRRVVEEEVTEIVSDDGFEAWEKQQREKRERMKFEQNRMDSFPSWWLHRHHLDVSDARRLAKAGFYCTFGGITECFSCELCKTSSFWRQHDPETVHREERPNCEFITVITGQSDNVPKGLSVLRRFQSFVSNKSKQNQDIKQSNNNQIKSHSGNEHLEPYTGGKPKRFGENETSDEKQKNNIEVISRPSLPILSKVDKPQEEEVYKLEPLTDKIQNDIKKTLAHIREKHHR